MSCEGDNNMHSSLRVENITQTFLSKCAQLYTRQAAFCTLNEQKTVDTIKQVCSETQKRMQRIHWVCVQYQGTLAFPKQKNQLFAAEGQ